MIADSLFPSCCPVFEALCEHVDDGALVKLCTTQKKRAVVSAMREMARRPVFALLKDISENGGWRCCDTMYDVCETGSVWGVQLMIQHGANGWNWGLWGACRGGHRDLAELMIKGENNWNEGLGAACIGGHRDLAELMIQHGANVWNDGLRSACDGGNSDLVELMIQHGAFVCDSFGCPGHEFTQ